jgi:hypothetical protein
MGQAHREGAGLVQVGLDVHSNRSTAGSKGCHNRDSTADLTAYATVVSAGYSTAYSLASQLTLEEQLIQQLI